MARPRDLTGMPKVAWEEQEEQGREAVYAALRHATLERVLKGYDHALTGQLCDYMGNNK